MNAVLATGEGGATLTIEPEKRMTTGTAPLAVWT